MKSDEYYNLIKNHPGNFLNKTGMFKDIKKIPKEYKKEYQELRSQLKLFTDWMPQESTDIQRMRVLKHNLKADDYFCPVCLKPRSYNTKKQEFMITCNTKNKQHRDYTYNHISKSREKTFLQKYGVKSYTSTEEFREKSKASLIEKYGVDNAFKSKEIQRKVKMTNLKKFGAEYPNQQSTFEKQIIEYGIEKFKENYINPKLDIIKIKNDFECSVDTIYRTLRLLNIPYPKCSGSSRPEEEIIKFIKELDPNIEIITNSRKIIPPKELDIYLPEYNLAIEYNGLMFHSRGISRVPMFNTPDLNKNIHLEKTEACESKGIHLLHIFENEWLDPKLRDIWKSVIRNKLGKAQNKIGARKLTFATKEQLLKNSKAFLEENHLQGSGAIGSIRYGLVDKAGELLALMTFGKSRFSNTDFELVRFAIKKNYSIPGAASRLLKAFEHEHPNKKIVSYANRRWSEGNLYEALGFKLKNISSPNFYVFKPGNFQLWHRVSFQKHKLKDKLDFFDPEQTAEWNVFQNGYRKIYDSGNYVFIKN